MAGYIGSKSSVTLVDGYTEAEADAEFVTKTGDTMSGNLDVTGTVSAVQLDITAGTDAKIYTSNTIGEVGTGNFAIQSVNSAGTALRPLGFRAEDIRFATGSSERMRIDSSGRLLLGTTTSFADGNSENLQIAGSGNTGMIIKSGSANYGSIYFGDATSGGARNAGIVRYFHNDNSMQFWTNETERMRIDSSGHVLVGKTNANNTDVGTTIYNTLGFSSTRSGGVVGILNRLTNDGDIMQFRKNNATVGSISVSGSSTSYNTSSDYRLKENVVDLTGASARVNQLNPSRFNFISDDTNTVVDGFLAHEVADVVPEAITGTKDAMKDEEYEVTSATGDIYTPATEAYVDDDGNDVDAVDEVIHSADAEQPETLEDGQQWRETTAAVMGTRSVPDYQGIDQSKLVPLLTAALQEALTEIASLKTRVEALEA